MLDTEEFIETQANFQFGTCKAPPGLDIEALATREASTRPSFALHNTMTGAFVPADRGFGISKHYDQWVVDFGDEKVVTAKRLKAVCTTPSGVSPNIGSLPAIRDKGGTRTADRLPK